MKEKFWKLINDDMTGFKEGKNLIVLENMNAKNG